MAYGAYAPGNTIADALTPLQVAYRKLPLSNAQETLEMIEKLTRNVVRNPGEEKFRKIKLTNPKIAAAITDVPGAVDLLTEMGWVAADDGLVLPPTVSFVHEREVLTLIEAKDWWKKEEENEKKRAMRARKEHDPEQARLKAALEADRKERAADGPVTISSKAQAMPGEGARICRAADVGIGQNAGG